MYTQFSEIIAIGSLEVLRFTEAVFAVDGPGV